MRVGIICEGSTDFVVLEALAQDLLPADECVLLHPDFDKLRATGLASGWQGVRKFLQTSAAALGLAVYDAFIIQVDASVRKGLELTHSEEEGFESLEPLREHVRGWAAEGLPESAIIVLPREELEAWLVAAHTNVKDVEALEDPAGELAARGIIGQKKGRPDKDSKVYRELANPALVKFALDAKKLRRVPELERFVGELRARGSRGRGLKR